MAKLIGLFGLAGIGILVFFTNCNQGLKNTLTSDFANNVSVISLGFVPASFDAVQQQNPCSGVPNFAVCQLNSAVQYLKIGKTIADNIVSIAAEIGKTAGDVPDSNSGTTQDGKISWNKTSEAVWSVLQRGAGGAPLTYISMNNGVYVFKYNANVESAAPTDLQIEAHFNFTDSNTWTADIYSGNNVCSPLQPEAPTKTVYKLTRAANGPGLWTGKAMMYFPHWQRPGAATVTCATNSEVAFYSDFAGNPTSTKSAIYLIPATLTTLASAAVYGLNNFCTNFSTLCGGTGQPTSGALGGFTNNYCRPGSNSVVWANNCTGNLTVEPAPFLADGQWIAPSDLKIKTVTLPIVL